MTSGITIPGDQTIPKSVGVLKNTGKTGHGRADAPEQPFASLLSASSSANGSGDMDEFAGGDGEAYPTGPATPEPGKTARLLSEAAPLQATPAGPGIPAASTAEEDVRGPDKSPNERPASAVNSPGMATDARTIPSGRNKDHTVTDTGVSDFIDPGRPEIDPRQPETGHGPAAPAGLPVSSSPVPADPPGKEARALRGNVAVANRAGMAADIATLPDSSDIGPSRSGNSLTTRPKPDTPSAGGLTEQASAQVRRDMAAPHDVNGVVKDRPSIPETISMKPAAASGAVTPAMDEAGMAPRAPDNASAVTEPARETTGRAPEYAAPATPQPQKDAAAAVKHPDQPGDKGGKPADLIPPATNPAPDGTETASTPVQQPTDHLPAPAKSESAGSPAPPQKAPLEQAVMPPGSRSIPETPPIAGLDAGSDRDNPVNAAPQTGKPSSPAVANKIPANQNEPRLMPAINPAIADAGGKALSTTSKTRPGAENAGTVTTPTEPRTATALPAATAPAAQPAPSPAVYPALSGSGLILSTVPPAPASDSASFLPQSDIMLDTSGLGNQISQLTQPGMAGAASEAAGRSLPSPSLPVAVEIARRFNNGVHSFRIQIDPPEMGRIDVRLEMRGHGKVRAHLAVEKPETLAMLQRDAVMLERALNNAGLDTASRNSLNFTLQDNGSGSRHNRHPMNTPPSAPGSGLNETADNSPGETPSRHRAYIRAGGVDIHV